MRRYIGLAFAVVLAVAIAFGMRYMLGQQTASRSGGVGQVTIGGPFTLVNQDGKTVTDKDFRGRYMLVYFGYTFCPDVCPTSLATIADALDMIGKKADKVVPILITIDPERDTPAALKAYVPNFYPRLVGLSGSAAQIKAVAKEYRVYYARVDSESKDGNYLMDHSAITYLMGPDGKYVTHFSHGVKAEDMAKKLNSIL